MAEVISNKWIDFASLTIKNMTTEKASVEDCSCGVFNSVDALDVFVHTYALYMLELMSTLVTGRDRLSDLDYYEAYVALGKCPQELSLLAAQTVEASQTVSVWCDCWNTALIEGGSANFNECLKRVLKPVQPEALAVKSEEGEPAAKKGQN